MPFPSHLQIKTQKKPKRFTQKQKVDLFNFTKILVCGDREWVDYILMLYIFGLFNPDVIIIHGSCKGADLMAEDIAKKKQMHYMGFPAKWNQYGKNAGPIRNARMLIDAKPEVVIAFHNNLKNSKGTKDMVERAQKRGVPTFVINR